MFEALDKIAKKNLQTLKATRATMCVVEKVSTHLLFCRERKKIDKEMKLNKKNCVAAFCLFFLVLHLLHRLIDFI